VTEKSQVSLKGHRDLFGELIPQDEFVSNADNKNKLPKNTPITKERKQPNEENMIDSPCNKTKKGLPQNL